jgi:Ser/Thr protein kinase RdoA (MazF antagonist)
VARGEQGQVWRLTSDEGTWAVKESFERESEAEARTAAGLQEAARAAGVPAPQILRTHRGEFVTQVDGAWVRVYEWAELLDPDATLDPAAVGELLARLHRVGHPCEGQIHPWHTEPVGAPRWQELAAAVATCRAPFADQLAEQVEALVAVEQALAPMRPIQLCHLDLWADNLRQRSGGGLCVIDWENAGPADPSRELALVLFEFGRTDPERLATLYASYLAAGGPGRVERPSDFSLVVAQLGHMLERHLSMWLDPADEAAQEHSLEGIDEALGEPLDLAVVDQVLAALAVTR